MKTIKLKDTWGEHYQGVAQKAKELATEKNSIVEFEFNDCINYVSKDTNLDWLWRDYANNWLMGWERVGPNCVAEYDEATKAEMAEKQLLKDIKDDEQRKEWKRKDNEQEEAYNKAVEGLTFEFSNEELWNNGIAKNQDAYGGGVYTYAKCWGLLMQSRINKGEKLIDIANETSHQLGWLGITGFMYGAAVSVLSSTWKYGEELRKWHNKDYGHEGGGVVNPAILTINTDGKEETREDTSTTPKNTSKS